MIDGFNFTHRYHDTDIKVFLSYMAHLATRGIVYIQADNPKLGLVAFVTIGMADCSTSELTISKGDRVKKGDDIGCFHFGGSTFLLIFQPGVNLKFEFNGKIEDDIIYSPPVHVNSNIATVVC